MSLFATTAHRVTANTAGHINERIRRETDARIASLSRASSSAIRERLRALDREWDIDRCLETGASSLVLAGSALGATVDRKWFWVSAGAAAFLMQYAIQGWCPPLPVFRRLGVRTADEINYERITLRSIEFARTSVHGAGSDQDP